MTHLETHFPIHRNEHSAEIVVGLVTMRQWVYLPYQSYIRMEIARHGYENVTRGNITS
jgi:hypothetical protein